VSVFWDIDGILLADYPEKGATTTGKYYVALLDKLRSNCSPNIEASLQNEFVSLGQFLLLTRWPLRSRK
jgi:hypothetical protein